LPAALTTLIVSVLFGLFAYENLDAIQQTTVVRYRALDAIKQSDASAPEVKAVRELLEPALTPATMSSVRTTHLVSDILTIAALWAMELRRRKAATSVAAP
jgi:hypothetical protein